MSEIFARFITPVTYLMFAMLIVGGIDHFAVEFLPRNVAQWNLNLMWPVLAIVWFGHKYKERMKAQTMRDDANDGA